MDFKRFFFKFGLFGLFLVQHGNSINVFDIESTPATWENAKTFCGKNGYMMVPALRYKAQALVRSLTEGQELWLNGWRAASGLIEGAEGKLFTVYVNYSRSVHMAVRIVCKYEYVIYEPGYKAKTIEDARAVCARDKSILADIKTEKDFTYLTWKLVKDTPHWVNSMSSTASPIKQCLMAKRVDNDVVYNYDDCERQLHFICLKDDGLIESFSPLISLKKVHYEVFQPTIEQHKLYMSSLSSVVMTETSTVVLEISVSTATSVSSSLIRSYSVPSATSIFPSESSSFIRSAVEDKHSEIITPLESFTYFDSQSLIEAEHLTLSTIPVPAGTKSVSIDETKSTSNFSIQHTQAKSSSDVVIPFTDSESESLELSSSTVTEVLESPSDTDFIDLRTNIIGIQNSTVSKYPVVGSTPTPHITDSVETISTHLSQVTVVTTPTDTDLYDDIITDYVVVDNMSDFDFQSSTSETDTQYSMSELYTYSRVSSSDTFSSTPFYDTKAGMSGYRTDHYSMYSGLETSFTSEYRHQTSPSLAQKTSVSHAPVLSETDLSELADISDTMASEYIPIRGKTSMTFTETTTICQENDPYTVCSDTNTTQIIDDSSSDFYSEIMPLKSIVLMESFLVHTKDIYMKSLSGSEKTHILTTQNAYDYQVTKLPFDDYESSGFDDNDTFDEIYKVKFYDVSTRSDLHSEITPSKSLVLIQLSPLYSKDTDTSKMPGTEKTHILTSQGALDNQVTELPHYDSIEFGDTDTYEDIDKDKLYYLSTSSDMYSTITPSTSPVLIQSLHIHTKDTDMSKLSGSEKTHILTTPSTYDYQVTESAFYDGSGFEDNDTYEDIYRNQLYEISTSADLYSEMLYSKSLALVASSPLYSKETNISKMYGTEKTNILTSQSALDNQVTELPRYDSIDFGDTDTYEDIDKDKLYDMYTSSDLYSTITPSKSPVLIQSPINHTKDTYISKMSGSEKTHILTSPSTYDNQVTESPYDDYDSSGFSDNGTYDYVYINKFYDISTSSELYSKITPSKSIVLMESFPIHTKDTNMSKMSGTERTSTIMFSSTYDYQVTQSPYDSNDSSGFDNTDTLGDIYKDNVYDISTSSDYFKIMPSKSLDSMESFPIHIKDSDKSCMSESERTHILTSPTSKSLVLIQSSPIYTKDTYISKMSDSEKTHILTSPSTYDIQLTDSPYDGYDSSGFDDNATAAPPVIVIEGVTASNTEGTSDNSGLTKTTIDATIEGDVSEKDDFDDDNRLGNQSDDKTRGTKAKEPKEAFSETEVGLLVTFGILALIVVVFAVFLAVFFWRRHKRQKLKVRMKPDGAAPPPEETVESRGENGATRETVTFKDPAYDI